MGAYVVKMANVILNTLASRPLIFQLLLCYQLSSRSLWAEEQSHSFVHKEQVNQRCHRVLV